MSADGNLKFTFAPELALGVNPRTQQRTCALCELPLKGHPVLLKGGRSVHVECYFRMKKDSASVRKN
jgi:hypothetical protein